MKKAIRIGFDVAVWGGFVFFMGGMILSLPTQAREKLVSWTIAAMSGLASLL